VNFFSFISGLLQGVTEFLPVSSSGHLVLIHHLLKVKSDQLSFDLLLHVGTFASAVLYFRRDILRLFGEDKKTLEMIILANIPFFIGCVIFKEYFEKFYGNPFTVFLFLGLNGIFLLAAHFAGERFRSSAAEKISPQAALLVGFCQIFALLPGISRSGSTIAAAIFIRVSMPEAFRFSFLMSMPAIAGAIIFKAKDLTLVLETYSAANMLTGILTAFLAGLLALRLLYSTIITRKLYLFGLYCCLMSLLGLTAYLRA